MNWIYQLEVPVQPTPVIPTLHGGDATGIMMAAAKLATTATGSATTNKVDDVIDDINKKKQSIRSEAEVNIQLTNKCWKNTNGKWNTFDTFN